ncbi:auxin-responsive protein [Musa troglodytarum]|uniref:Auxin-responsive protein n=1 Tax=Musa troglodytarum TaxID=320322 RepID=A0A9E7GYJ6_9LILI|nr:auxin-responsive protein [Musa troglodytarum]
MFSCFTARNYPNERLVDPVNGTEYVPTYEDKDGCLSLHANGFVDEKLRSCRFRSSFVYVSSSI